MKLNDNQKTGLAIIGTAVALIGGATYQKFAGTAVPGPKSLTVDRVFKWQYPELTGAYNWSLQSSTNFSDWIVVTNYPFGYTDDVFTVSAKSIPKIWFRMHGTTNALWR